MDSSVVECWTHDPRVGHGFKSLQEQWENFLLWCQLSVLTLILV